MKTTKSIIVVLFVLLTAQIASAYYCPSTGRWLSRDPIDEPGFQTSQMASVVRSVAGSPQLAPSRWINRDSPVKYTSELNPLEENAGNDIDGSNVYNYVRNAPLNFIDGKGLIGMSSILDLLGIAVNGPCGNVSVTGSLSLSNYHVTGIGLLNKAGCLGITALLGKNVRDALKNIPYSKKFGCNNCANLLNFGPYTFTFSPSSPITFVTNLTGDIVSASNGKCKVELDLNGSITAAGALGYCCNKK